MYLFRILLIVCVACAAPLTLAATTVQQCKQVVVAGNDQWQPYTVTKAHAAHSNEIGIDLAGIGIELAELIFAELDVPIVETSYSDPSQMQLAMHNGDIDLIVSTYDYIGLHLDANVLEPAFIIDHATIAVPTSKSSTITSWDDLVGRRGIKETGIIFDDVTHEYVRDYLTVTSKGDLLDSMEQVIKGEYDYLMGSHLQLTYAINSYDLNSELIVMKNLIKGGNVHMAFSNDSACKLYALYVQKRLQDYKNNGTVDKILNKYIY